MSFPHIPYCSVGRKSAMLIAGDEVEILCSDGTHWMN